MASLTKWATVFYAVVVAVSAFLAWIFDAPLLGDRAPTPVGLLHGLWVGLAIVLLCHATHRYFKSFQRASRIMAEFFGPIRFGAALWLAVISGFAEEIAFRGALWPALGLIGSSILFGVLHTVPIRALAGYPIFAAIAGLIFGLLREKTGSVWPPMLAHMTVNALNIAWLGWQERQRIDMSPPPPLPPPPGPPPPSPPIDERETVDLHVDQDVPDSFPMTVWRYDLRIELTGTDRANLPDCLEHEDLALFQHVPREEVYRELREGLFVFAESSPGPLPSFASDVAAFSAYLFQFVEGIEVAERYVDDTTTDDVRAWKIVARRGEWVKVPLIVAETEEGKYLVDPDREDLEVVAAQWSSYPRWFQDGMRFKYPRLRDL